MGILLRIHRCGLPAVVVANLPLLSYDSSNYEMIVVRQAPVIEGGADMDHGSMDQVMNGMGGDMMGGGSMCCWAGWRPGSCGRSGPGRSPSRSPSATCASTCRSWPTPR